MAQHYTDFSGYTTGQVPSDWSVEESKDVSWSVQSDQDAEGGQAIVFSSGFFDTADSISWDSKSGSDIEAVKKWKRDSDADAGGIILRGAISGGTHGYFVRPLELGGIEVRSLDGSIGDSIASTGGENFNQDEWYYIRFRANGTDLKAKYWAANNTEPSGWDIETTDSDHSSGWIGLGHLSSDVTFDVDTYGVGTEGDSAPTEPVTADPPSAPTNLQLSEQ